MLRRLPERALGWIACLPARAQCKLLGEMVLLPQGLNGTLVRAVETEFLPRTVILEQISGGSARAGLCSPFRSAISSFSLCALATVTEAKLEGILQAAKQTLNLQVGFRYTGLVLFFIALSSVGAWGFHTQLRNSLHSSLSVFLLLYFVPIKTLHWSRIIKQIRQYFHPQSIPVYLEINEQ